MTEYVNVRITGEMRVKYDQTAKIPRAEFDRLNAMLNSGVSADERKAEEQIGALWIDQGDVSDADDFELEDFIIDKSESEVS
jgi:hypothetical protein